jgi:sterol desaturase/sphingolipid hydroxylase (fatty acid hydroxylase superfamily)
VTGRWSTNLALFGFQFGLQKLLVPLSALVAALGAQKAETGLLTFLGVPAAAGMVAGILLLDVWKYWEHRLMHAVPALWRLHRVHHSDVEIDFTTSERHHPLEVMLSIAGLFAVIYLLGIPPEAVLLYSLIATAVVVLSHANIEVPQWLDGALRNIVVTPAFHVVHHYADRRETDTNFALVITLWDRIFGSLHRENATVKGNRQVLGIEDFREPRDNRLHRVLLQPFLSTGTNKVPESGSNDKPRLV